MPNTTPRRIHAAFVGSVAVTLFVGLFLLAVAASRRLPGNSDNASEILQALSMLHGNVLLHGWNLGADTWWTLDGVAYAAGIILAGFTPALIHTVPAFLYVATSLLAALLAAAGLRGRHLWAALGVAIFLLALPSGQATIPAQYYLLQGPMHVATVGAALAAWGAVWLSLASKGTAARRWWLAGSVLLFTLAAANDPLVAVCGVLPAGLLLGARALRGEAVVHRDLTALGFAAATAGLVAGRILVRGAELAGGFSTIPFTPTVVGWSSIPLNAALVIRGLLSLFGANVFGLPLTSPGTIVRAVHLLVLGGLCWAAVDALRGTDEMARLMAAIFLVDCLAYLAYTSNPADATTARYLLPAWFAAPILLGRVFSQRLPSWAGPPSERRLRRGTGLAIAGAVLCSYIGGFAVWMQRPIPVSQDKLVGLWLEAHHLYHGLGEYWDSNIITVETSGRVAVRPVTAVNSSLVPRNLQTKTSWYGYTPATSRRCGAPSPTFLVTGLPGNPNPHSKAVLAAAVAHFGPPSQSHTLNGITVSVWPRNIVRCIS